MFAAIYFYDQSKSACIVICIFLFHCAIKLIWFYRYRSRIPRPAGEGDLPENELGNLATISSHSNASSSQCNNTEAKETALATDDEKGYEALNVDDMPRGRRRKIYQSLPSSSVKLCQDNIKQHIKAGDLALEYQVCIYFSFFFVFLKAFHLKYRYQYDINYCTKWWLFYTWILDFIVTMSFLIRD